ncbi:Tautomerase/MIF [Cylindrobasidium torrendii FP15055 ss-10]|uniref:L-dopachrome isomerase n=1 Tax=Cylindrobasidium torrendii FP15055 ss-10 TaxID=1314674 RepID=A0A0D7BMG6_9AGAR|nr:Tautomerase/MIF [Cylindrobasidium torrendii FP15055 ss-10]
MPSLQLNTNAKIADVTAFALEFSKESARILSKDESSLVVSVLPVPVVVINGTAEPAFQLFVASLDNLSPSNTQKFSKAFSEFLNKSLGLSNDRGLIVFLDPGADNIGFLGNTSAGLVAQGLL